MIQWHWWTKSHLTLGQRPTWDCDESATGGFTTFPRLKANPTELPTQLTDLTSHTVPQTRYSVFFSLRKSDHYNGLCTPHFGGLYVFKCCELFLQMPSRMPDLPTAGPVRMCLVFVPFFLCYLAGLASENRGKPVTSNRKGPAGKFFYYAIPCKQLTFWLYFRMLIPSGN